jgi:hypothetical protein
MLAYFIYETYKFSILPLSLRRAWTKSKTRPNELLVLGYRFNVIVLTPVVLTSPSTSCTASTKITCSIHEEQIKNEMFVYFLIIRPRKIQTYRNVPRTTRNTSTCMCSHVLCNMQYLTTNDGHNNSNQKRINVGLMSLS